MIIHERDIPDYLRPSAYLQALLSEGPIPESGIEIPDGCLKADLTVTTEDDLLELLFTLRFWLLPELATHCKDLMCYAFNPTAEASFLECAADFKNDIPYVNELTKILANKPANRVSSAVKFSRTHVVKYLVDELLYPVPKAAGVTAAREGNLECLEYLHLRGLKLTVEICDAACCGGNLSCVKYMIDQKAEFHTNCAQFCATNGHFECVKFVVCRSVELRSSSLSIAFEHAARCVQIECLQLMLVEWPAVEHITLMLRTVAGCGVLEVLKLVVNNGFVLSLLDDDLIRISAVKGHVDCVQYLHEHGCPLTVNALKHAAGSGCTETFRYLIEHGCPWNASICEILAREDNLELLQYAHEHGCPWEEGTCTMAAEVGSLECLKYAHENGCPWTVVNINSEEESGEESGIADEGGLGSEQLGQAALGVAMTAWEDVMAVKDISVTAASAPTIDCLLYVEAQGVLLHPNCGRYAARSRCLEILQYLHARGFTWGKEDCATAGIYGSLECLRFLHEIGTPWDAVTCHFAARWGSLACLQYAHEQGCPWNKDTCAGVRSPECREYLAKNGCPGAEKSKVAKL